MNTVYDCSTMKKWSALTCCPPWVCSTHPVPECIKLINAPGPPAQLLPGFPVDVQDGSLLQKEKKKEMELHEAQLSAQA